MLLGEHLDSLIPQGLGQLFVLGGWMSLRKPCMFKEKAACTEAKDKYLMAHFLISEGLLSVPFLSRSGDDATNTLVAAPKTVSS